MMTDIENVDSIKILVNEFYRRVRSDSLLAPVFATVITGDWEPHLDKMVAFWNAALFGVPGFHGNPFAKHAPLPIGEAHFERWLELFNRTIDEYFQGAVAEDARNRAGLMAEMFKAKLLAGRNPARVII